MTTAILAASLILQAPDRSFDFQVFMNGAKSGSAKITVKDLPDARRQVLLTMNLKVGSKASRVRQETIYERDGAASRKIAESGPEGGQLVNQFAELTNAGAKVTTRAEGKTSEKMVPLSANAPRSNPSTFWFDRTQPKPGEKISYYSFEMGESQWRLMTSTYLGVHDYVSNGRTIKAHKVIVSRGGEEVTNWMDNKGMPIALVQGDAMRIERTPLPPSVR